MTTLIRWSPFQDLDVIERRMRRMLEDWGVAPATLPAADMYETEKELVVELDVPGFEEKELALEVTDHMLTIKGERTAEKEEKDKSFYLHERLEKHFERGFKQSGFGRDKSLHAMEKFTDRKAIWIQLT